jgi:sodium transport system ATP-binding protein
VMTEVEKLCDRIGIIHGGKLLAEGTLADLRARHGMNDLEDIFVEVVTGAASGAVSGTPVESGRAS